MRVSFFPGLDLKEAMSHRSLYRPSMSHSVEKWHQPIKKPIKYRCQCTISNKINSNFGHITKEQTMCRSYGPIKHVLPAGLI